MKVETLTKTESVKTEQQIVRYTDKEIEALILADMQHNGLKGKSVKFKTDYGYVYDEWGMNRHITSWLKGAVVDLETE